MKTAIWSKGILCCITLILIVGCQTFTNAKRLSVTPVVPKENEQIIRDQLIILVDVTGSIGSTSVYEEEKALVQAFTAAMPDGKYESGMDSFAGVKSSLCVKQPLEPFSRTVMARSASSLKPLGSLTPLARAIRCQEAEFSGKPGRSALLVFSDGKVRIPEEVLQACQDIKAAHNGELCIFTVQVGSSERGAKLLQEMAAVNGCGKYYDGASLNTAAAIDAMVRDIFLGPKEAPQPAPKPAPPAVAWKLNNILFDNDSSVIASTYDGLLGEAVAMTKENPKIRIHLQGHTDSNASTQYNQKLSERRVNAVKAALVQRGVDASRLETNAYGENKPLFQMTVQTICIKTAESSFP